MMWYVYIVQCRDGSFYTGTSTNLDKRISCHNSGRGSQYTRHRRPVVLVYKEKCSDRQTAQIREVEIKRLSIKNKERLIHKGTDGFPSA